MGGSGSSSRPKSLKKKRKRSRSKNKKSWRKESKRRRHDSVSSESISDESDSSRREQSSRSKSGYKIRKRRKNRKQKLRRDDFSDPDDCFIRSDSGSLPSSDEDRARRRSRKIKGRSKSSRKTGRKRVSSSDSDSDEYNSRKRKRSDGGHGSKKRKKSKKYASYSSESCSTCWSRSSSSGEDGGNKRKRRTDKSWEKRVVRSRSYSSPERYSDRVVDVPCYDTAISGAPNSRRLRSVIAVADPPRNEMERRLEKESHKEEIVYDQEDDYPSPRSVDSDEECGRAGSGHHLNEANEEVPEKTGKYRTNEGDRLSNVASVNEFKEEAGFHASTASVEEDMESILRQRALENFRKYKADSKTAQNCDNAISGRNADSPRVDETQNTSSKQGVSDSPELQTADSILKEDSFMKGDVRGSPHNEHINMSQPPPSLQACSEEGKVGASSENPSSIGDADITGRSATTEPSSAVPSEGDKPKDSASQFEQKTMTVMRGGEMVEVSYKVYIPKRPPALSRRQLKR